MRTPVRNFFFSLALAATVTMAQTPVGPKGEARQASAGLDHRVPVSPRTLRKPVSANKAGAQAPISLLGSAPTPSAASSFAINGNIAYVCDDNEVTVVNVANPANPQVIGTAVSTLIHNTGLIYCSIQRGTLSVFADQSNSSIGNSPGYAAFNLSNPNVPQLIANTPLNKRFFQAPVYIGNFAFVPTAALQFSFGQWDTQNGDMLSVDLTNFASPLVTGTLQTPQIHPQFGGANAVLGATQADSSVVYLGGSSSTANQNNGVGRLQAVDVANPAATKVITQLAVPGTIHFSAPLIQGTVAVGIGNTGGYVSSFGANPVEKGNIVVATFDVVDRRTPALITTVRTNYKVGVGGGATRIGANLFAFAGVADIADNPVLLVVDTTDPNTPVIQSYPIGQPFTSMQAIGNTLYATLGAAGFATYSIPGGLISNLNCPTSLDAVVVFDRSASVSSTSFANAKNALKSFTNALQLPSDKLGVVSFDQAALLTQQLTGTAPTAKRAIDGLTPASATSSYIGAGITAAQAELTGPRRTATATPVMIIVSDGRDTGAPSAGATLAAATAAKAAGIRVIALQYGVTSGSLMQSLASSATDFYLAP